MLHIEKVHSKSPDLSALLDLYLEAFPSNERIPMALLLQKAKKDFVDFVAFYEEKNFVGFAYLITYQDLTFIYYLAVDPAQRSKGYGQAALAQIAERYPHHRLVLNIEEPDPEADNYEQRVKRKQFYLSNGYRNADYRLIHAKDRYEVLAKGEAPIPYEFLQLFKRFIGPLMYIFFKPRLVPCQEKGPA